MNDIEMNELKADLLARRERLQVERRRRLDEVESSGDHNCADDIDRAAETHDFEVAVQSAFRNGEELDAIEGALERLAADEFGQCEECDETIASPRLRALPFATLCIECQRELELHGGYARSAIDRESWRPQ